MLIVTSAVKEHVKGDIRMSKNFIEALDDKVKAMIKEACKRAGANDRKTVKASDL